MKGQKSIYKIYYFNADISKKMGNNDENIFF